MNILASLGTWNGSTSAGILLHTVKVKFPTVIFKKHSLTPRHSVCSVEEE